MKHYFIDKNTRNRSLIVIFSGWATDESLFLGLHKPGYDILVVYDYRNPDFGASLVAGYDEIVVIGWSFGVYFAHKFITENPALPITKCIAVNGSPNPVDDSEGIPCEIFEKTALLPDARALDKFYTRICGGARARAQLMPIAPTRDLDELREELRLIKEYIDFAGPANDLIVWDEVLLADGDLIFPVNNLRTAWQPRAHVCETTTNAPHLPDFQKILNSKIINKITADEKFRNARTTYDDNAGVQAEVAQRLYDLFIEWPRSGARSKVLEIGSGTGLFTNLYINDLGDCDFVLADFSPEPVVCDEPSNTVNLVSGDAETYLRSLAANSFEVVNSSSTIQWFNSPLKALREIHRILKPGGVAEIAYFDHRNLPELKEFINPLPVPEIIAEDLETLGFNIVTMLRQNYPMQFETPLAALRSLHDTGVNGLGNSRLSPGQMRSLLSAISTPEGRGQLNYSVTYLILKNI